MELRVLRYFLETAREGNMTRAAARLHVTQPTLSKQIKELENELGKQLFIRGNFNVTLTEEGMILRKRAEDLLAMADKIENEFRTMDDITGGEVSIGCAESDLIRYLAEAVRNLNSKYSDLHYHVISGGTDLVIEKLNQGIVDMAIIVEQPDLSRYNYLEIPESNVWGALIRKDNPLSSHDVITVDDLIDVPVFCSEQSIRSDLPRWGGERSEKLNIMTTFNLTNNAFVFVKEGLGVALTFEKILEITSESSVVFRPLYPPLETKMYLVWKKYQVFTPAAQALLDEFKQLFLSKKESLHVQ